MSTARKWLSISPLGGHFKIGALLPISCVLHTYIISFSVDCTIEKL